MQLDAEGWDRLITWIDLNCPFHGTWGEDVGNPGAQRQRRRELLKLYGNVDDDPEAIPQLDPRGRYARPSEPLRPAAPAAAAPAPVDGPRNMALLSRASVVFREESGTRTAQESHATIKADCPNWPFDAGEARRRQQAAGDPWQRTVALGDGLEMRLVLIPAGEFIIGSSTGALDERPPRRVRLETPFWMGACEVTNRQYAQFDRSHDSHFESMLTACHGVHGHPVNRPEQPVVRVSWMRAMDFCRWLSEKTGARFSLPTEAQWEWACRAGTATPMSYGAVDTDFSPFANLADAKLSHLARDWYILEKPIPNPTKYDDWIPKEPRFDDGAVLSIAPGQYRPNAWGLHDMHGNVAEWTRTSFRPHPYGPADGRDADTAGGRKVVRGGSWRERPQFCTSSFRLSYPPYQRVYNVGFRVVCQWPGRPVAHPDLCSGGTHRLVAE